MSLYVHNKKTCIQAEKNIFSLPMPIMSIYEHRKNGRELNLKGGCLCMFIEAFSLR